ncbi:uncharacterized protein LOC111694385 [Trichogramma pretiosum]|uniref:uncharacterized protein LOC111694385 n=1 Tax=Trichogramma pretiosum TaxID=7493 RepID=UPI000C71B9E0|nr:uncharacterized protein LOC111694385 [Trichogramma pretiosum]
MSVGVYGGIVVLVISCLPSQLINDSSSEIGLACYRSNWYQWEPKIRLAYLLVMIRTSSPCGWKGTKFFENDDAFFGYILLYEITVSIFFLTFISLSIGSYIFYSYLIIIRFQQISKKFETLQLDQLNTYNLELSDDKIQVDVIATIKKHDKCINYRSNWYQWEPKVRLAYLLVMIRTSSPYEWKAGPIFVLNFEMVAFALVQFKKGFVTDALQMGFGFLSCIITLVLLCIPSQFIIDVSDKVGHACYFNTNWYEWKPKDRLVIRRTLMRTLYPCGWKAGPSITLNLRTAAFVIKTAMSYVMTMISIYA